MDFVLKKINYSSMKGQALSSLSIPLLQHIIVSFLLFEPHFDEHSHLLKLNVTLFFVFRKLSMGFIRVEIFLILSFFRIFC